MAEPTKRLYLDLDGVMADFDAHFPATFGLDHRGMADDALWATINAHPSYFLDMPPCEGAVEFFRRIEYLRPIILTACPKSNYAHVARQKREWVRRHLSEHVTVLPVLGGSNKPLFMQEAGDVLIDDFKRNIDCWDAAGGVGILHRSFEETGRVLSWHFASDAALVETGPNAESPSPQVMAGSVALDPAFGSKAASDLLAERRRQIVDEGWTPDSDDETHDHGDLAAAASCYALAAADLLNPYSQGDGVSTKEPPAAWPWKEAWWKISRDDPRRALVKAGALILAEIERMDRAAERTGEAT